MNSDELTEIRIRIQLLKAKAEKILAKYHPKTTKAGMKNNEYQKILLTKNEF